MKRQIFSFGLVTFLPLKGMCFLSRMSRPGWSNLNRSFCRHMKVDSDDPFQILGLEPTVDQKVIKRAYKRMALKYHPDVLAHGTFKFFFSLENFLG